MPSLPADPSDPPPAPPAAARRRGWIVVVLVAAALAVGGYMWWTSRATPAAAGPGAAAAPRPPSGGQGKGGDGMARALPVIAEPVRRETIDVYLNALGTVTPRNRHRPAASTASSCACSSPKASSSRPGRCSRRSIRGRSRSSSRRPRGSSPRTRRCSPTRSVDLERYRTLFEQDSIAKQQLDTQAALVRQYEGTIKADQGAVDSAKLQLSYARVTAPIAGRIGLRQVDVGQHRARGRRQRLVVITQLQPISVVFTMPEDNVLDA